MLGDEKEPKELKKRSKKNTRLAMLAVRMAKAYYARRTKDIERLAAEILEIESLESDDK